MDYFVLLYVFFFTCNDCSFSGEKVSVEKRKERNKPAKMGKVRRQAAKSSGKTSKDSKTVTPGASQGLVFNTSGYGQHILKNPQVVQVLFIRLMLKNNSNFSLWLKKQEFCLQIPFWKSVQELET